jgi:hypothetical protein
MSAKEAFWGAIDADLPDSIRNLLEVTLDCAGVAAPADVDAAIIEQGKLAAKLNKLLDDLQGLSLVALALRIGQHNVTAKHLLFAGLQYLGEVDKEDKEGFKVLAPLEGQEYEAMLFTFKAQATDQNVKQISCRLASSEGGEETIELAEGDKRIFSGQTIIVPGEQTAVFFTPDTKEGEGITVNFYVTEFELVTYPADGDTTNTSVFEVRVNPPSDLSKNFKEVMAEITCQPLAIQKNINLLFDGAQGVWTALIDITPDDSTVKLYGVKFNLHALFEAGSELSDITQKTVNFFMELKKVLSDDQEEEEEPPTP